MVSLKGSKAAKKANTKKNKKAKRSSKDAANPASIPWSKRRQDKEKDREFIIPRGPNLDTAQTGELPLVAGQPSKAANDDARTMRENTSSKPLIGKVSVAASVASSTNPMRADSARAGTASEGVSNATVLSAAGARARRRAREQAQHSSEKN